MERQNREGKEMKLRKMNTQTLQTQSEIKQEERLGRYRVISHETWSYCERYRIDSFFSEMEKSLFKAADKGYILYLGIREKENEVFQVGDCAVHIHGYAPIWLNILNKNKGKRKESLKMLEGILK